MTDELRESALQLLQATPEILRLTIERFPASALESPADGDWSPKDVAAHLVLSGQKGAFTRIRAIPRGGSSLLPNIDENEELARSGLRHAEMATILNELAKQRAEDVEWLRALGEGALRQTGQHSEVGPVSGEELLYHAANHDCLHLRQLLGMLQQQFDPRRGPMRIY